MVDRSSPDTERLRQVLGAFCKTVAVMKSARNKDNLMNVWADDMKAVEDVVFLLETLRDAPAQCSADIGEPVAWQYKDSWKDHWSTCNERPAEFSYRTVRPLYPAPAQPPSDQLLANLVDWTWIHATEGAHWPSAATTETLIRKAKERGPTQEDAGRYLTLPSTGGK